MLRMNITSSIGLLFKNIGQIRAYNKQILNPAQPHGRSVKVGKQGGTKYFSANQAYFQLRSILQESRVRETFLYQKRFESNPARRSRKRKEADWRVYCAEVTKRLGKALHLKRRTAEEKLHYQEIS